MENYQCVKGKSYYYFDIALINDLEEIENLCDRVAILSKGKLLTVGTIDEVKSSVNANTFEDAFIKVVESANE